MSQKNRTLTSDGDNCNNKLNDAIDKLPELYSMAQDSGATGHVGVLIHFVKGEAQNYNPVIDIKVK